MASLFFLVEVRSGFDSLGLHVSKIEKLMVPSPKFSGLAWIAAFLQASSKSWGVAKVPVEVRCSAVDFFNFLEAHKTDGSLDTAL